MSDVIRGSINASLIEKVDMIQGKKGQYVDIVLIPSQNKQYGDDYFIIQGVTKEKREAMKARGEKSVILGNARIAGKRSETQAYNPPAPPEPPVDDGPGTDQGNVQPTMNDEIIPF